MTSWFRVTSILTFILLFAGTIRVDAAPQTKQETQSPTARAIGRKLSGQGVPNFVEVTPTLYRGGLLSGDGLKALKKVGVSVVIDTRAYNKHEKRAVEALGMKYVAIPWH